MFLVYGLPKYLPFVSRSWLSPLLQWFLWWRLSCLDLTLQRMSMALYVLRLGMYLEQYSMGSDLGYTCTNTWVLQVMAPGCNMAWTDTFTNVHDFVCILLWHNVILVISWHGFKSVIHSSWKPYYVIWLTSIGKNILNKDFTCFVSHCQSYGKVSYKVLILCCSLLPQSFQQKNQLFGDGTSCLGDNLSEGTSVPVVSRWLWPGNRNF